MIPDTSGQDRVLQGNGPAAERRRLLLPLLALGILALLAAALWAWAGGSRSVNAERLRFAEVGRGTLVRDAAVNGRTVAAVSPTLYAPVASTVALKIAAGDAVKKDQILAELDSPELSNELQRERATFEQLQAEVARQRILAEQARQLARREADEAEVTRLAAQRDLQRSERGYQLGAIAEVEFLKAKDALRTAEIRAGHASRSAGLAGQGAALELQTRQQQLERQRLLVADLERRVEALKVRAPVDGIVGTLSVADRAVVPMNTALMTVVDLSRLEVELAVPESYADDLGLGMSAEVRIGAVQATGKVSAISPEVVGGQVLARVRFDGEQPAGLRQNQRVSARILFEEKPDVLMLPRGPFVEQHGGRYAYVMDGSTAVRRPVELGATSVAAVEILSGLEVGDRVVIAGTDSFGDAETISVNE